MKTPRVYLFWDNSNIFISAKRVACRKEGISAENAVRLHFENLFRLSIFNRPVAKAIAVGSIPPEQEGLWERLKSDTGIEVELYERGEINGGEQGVDQCLQTHMLRSLADVDSPQIAVLLTGDGKGYDDGVGFHADLERMHNNGWGIEVISWNNSCKKNLRQWAEKNGVFVDLESYYESITFLEGTRYSNKLNLKHRKKAEVKTQDFENKSQRIAELEKEIQKLKYGRKTNARKVEPKKSKKKRGF